MTATSPPPGVSSSDENVRPNVGATPNVAKKLAEVSETRARADPLDRSRFISHVLKTAASRKYALRLRHS